MQIPEKNAHTHARGLDICGRTAAEKYGGEGVYSYVIEMWVWVWVWVGQVHVLDPPHPFHKTHPFAKRERNRNLFASLSLQPTLNKMQLPGASSNTQSKKQNVKRKMQKLIIV